MNRAVLWAWMGMLAGGAVAFALSCRLSLSESASDADSRMFSVAGQALSASRIALSGFLVEQADCDYHLGRDERHGEAFRDSFFQRIRDAMAPRDHLHLPGATVKEMMARIKMALISDPHNIEACLIASYWLAGPHIGRPNEARKVLLHGQARNPRSHEIQTELGILSLKEGNLEEARRFLDAGLRLWPGSRNPKAHQALLDREVLLTYRALLHENDGQIPRALEAWREILKMFPTRSDVWDRIRTLEDGKEPGVKASARWKAMLRKKDKDCGACHRAPNGSTEPVHTGSEHQHGFHH
ncbi:MAG: hypothetical protein QME60_06135 [Verrucomicrobiota bacterium]|nr:hypothetical protein [Verrucomicrobiota bacterium]